MIPPDPVAGPSSSNDRTLLRALLESIPDQIYFKDLQSRFIAASRSTAGMHGVSPDQIIGRTDFDTFSSEHARQTFADEQQIIATGQPIAKKVEKETWPDGRITWVTTTKLPLRNEAGEIIGTFGLSQDITEQRRTETALERTRKELVDTSRLAGMAEVATGVLHNVGNVLNSLNISSTLIASALRQSKADSLGKLSALLAEHRDDLGAYVTTDPKGRRIPEFIASLAAHALEERARLLSEVDSLQKNVDHIREIVSMQQAQATMVGVVEPLDPVALMEDSLRMNAGSLLRHEVQVVRKFEALTPVLAERGKCLQILVNLIANAKHAADDAHTQTGGKAKVITLRIAAGGPGRVLLSVSDNGIGILPENLSRIFAHGFTTRKNGHGFGLHSSANAATEMKGALTVQSDGPGLGATFTVELPAA